MDAIVALLMVLLAIFFLAFAFAMKRISDLEFQLARYKVLEKSQEFLEGVTRMRFEHEEAAK